MGESEKQLENDEERNMATIKDIAARAGVTATTVSRVINNRGYISEETRKKVTQAMQEMNYQPNELARSLAKAHSNTIGVIVPHISHPFFSKMISALESVDSFDMAATSVILCSSGNSIRVLRRLVLRTGLLGFIPCTCGGKDVFYGFVARACTKTQCFRAGQFQCFCRIFVFQF